MNELVFTFRENNVRVMENEGVELFVAKDVCEALGIKKYRDFIKDLDNDETVSISVDTNAGKRIMTAVNEYGLYKLIFKSRKVEAKEFQKWVTHEVLPSIRKKGIYATAETVDEMLQNPDTMIKMLEELKKERNERLLLQEELKDNAPKVLFHNAVAEAENTITIAELAKLITQNGYVIGQNSLYEWLRNNRYLIKKVSADWNKPQQRYIEMGLFRIQEQVTLRNGKSFTTTTTRVTGKGQQYFVNKFLGGLQVD